MCDECGAKIGGKSQMEKHASVHKTGKLLKCHVCLKVFDDSDHKQEHEDMELNVGQSTVPREVFTCT